MSLLPASSSGKLVIDLAFPRRPLGDAVFAVHLATHLSRVIPSVAIRSARRNHRELILTMESGDPLAPWPPLLRRAALLCPPEIQCGAVTSERGRALSWASSSALSLPTTQACTMRPAAIRWKLIPGTSNDRPVGPSVRSRIRLWYGPP